MRPELRQNQFGGSIGGPIYKNRTFFFGDYEGFREVNGLTYTKTTLTQNEYNDVNSLNGGSPQLLLNAGNGTQNVAVDPIALAYLKLYPAANAGAAGALTNNYITSPNRTQSSNSFDVRVDHKFNDHNLFFGRYDYNKVNTFTPPGLGTNAATGLEISGGQFDFDGPATDTAQQYGFGFTHIFTQNLPLGDGSTELGSTNFGVVSNFDPNYTPRLYQFALKAQFKPFNIPGPSAGRGLSPPTGCLIRTVT
jgi:hypothetical protein